MSGGGLDVEAFLDRLRGIATEWESAHDQLETLRVVASSPDRIATATADSGGAVIDLVLAAGLRGHGCEKVASAILEATSSAVEQANTRRAELVSGTVASAVSGRKQVAEGAGPDFGGVPTAGRGTG
ncbi:MAG: YbaB/EbfC family DNA-binding protein [Dietzia sp.]